MKLLSIVGARPQFIKLAPFIRSIDLYNMNNHDKIEHITVHTGQHYDGNMSNIFFDELNIPNADYNLGIGSGSHGYQTSKMLTAIEEILIDYKPDVAIVYGDTNSTLAGALSTSKLNIKLAHIEAGLRSFNKQMPEEVNRIVADHVSDILFAPTKTAVQNLSNEGLKEKTVFSGDIMYDAILYNKKIAQENSTILNKLSLEKKKYAVVTIHRAQNTDDISNLECILETINEISKAGLKIVFPIHPRTLKLIKEKINHWKPESDLLNIEPVGYLDMISLVDNSMLTLTDSGGLQKETFFLNIPCITLRNETEWIETVDENSNILCGISKEKILNAVSFFKIKKENSTNNIEKHFGKGNAAEIILHELINFVNNK